MAYRNGTYVAFHANGTAEPTESDMRYYNLLKAWHVREESDFEFVNSHDKTAAVRDSSARETLARSLRTRMASSKNMILIIGKTTKQDRDWIPYEIELAVDTYQIPLIVTYTGYERISAPPELAILWPPALYDRIDSGEARAIHIPFKQEPLTDAVSQFDINNKPNSALEYYNAQAYRGWGITA